MKGKMNGAGKINERFTVPRSSRLKSIPNSWCGHLLASDPTGTEAETHGKGAPIRTGGQKTCHPRMEQAQRGFWCE